QRKTRICAVAGCEHRGRLGEQSGADVALPHEPVATIVERVGAETGAQVLKPWYGMPWLYGGGIDVVYDTVGFPETVEVGVRIADSRGAIVITGVEAPKRFEWTPLYFKAIPVIDRKSVV